MIKYISFDDVNLESRAIFEVLHLISVSNNIIVIDLFSLKLISKVDLSSEEVSNEQFDPNDFTIFSILSI